ncbi:MAG: mannose-1-phosphate guanylyltransferase/mannose-6-phosphate isomerase, partial [Alphaproteobacteria bacterium HGW-Alphaproteobacteria-2]
PTALAERIVTFGIRPDRAETGYGWLAPEVAPPIGRDAPPWPLATFVEKPDRTVAEAMLAGGEHLWNAGIFLAAADTMLAAFAAHAPQILAAARAAFGTAERDLGFTRLAPGPWAEAEKISLDHAVMEKAGNLSVMPYDGAWSDLGDWEALWRAGTPEGSGVVTHGAATAIDCEDVLLRAEAEGQHLVGFGLSGLVAVALPDAVLVAPRARAQEVGRVVAALREQGVVQADRAARDHRPWGWAERLVAGPRFQVKRLVVNPGGRLSLQSHRHRAEHWVVVAGTARVTTGDEVRLVTENQSVYIPPGCLHRLENPGRLALTLIEVQTGSYLGEDDILRYDDAYARGPEP